MLIGCAVSMEKAPSCHSIRISKSAEHSLLLVDDPRIWRPLPMIL